MTGRLFYSSLMTETNSFSNIPTTYASFEESGILRSSEILYDADGAPRPSAAPLLSFAEEQALSIAPGLAASAEPGAPTEHADYCALRDEMLDALAGAMPVKAVLLALHGAMMSTAELDCEGDILRRVRRVVGPAVPVAAVLDPHAHLTALMVEQADFLVFMKEYPHTDGIERTRDALDVIRRLLDGSLALEVAVHNCELLGFYPTHDEPMRSFVDRLLDCESEDDVVSVSFIHGFPWGDNPDVGSKVLVYTDRSPALAKDVAARLSDHIWQIRDRTMFDTVDVGETVRMIDANAAKPAVFADVADNPGGGAAADSTFILKALLDSGVTGVALGLIFDPESVRRCHRAGVGQPVRLQIGGKRSAFSGMPVDVRARVRGLASDARMDVAGIVDFAMGDTAWVCANGVDIVMISVRVQTYSPHGFTHLGIDLAAATAIVVKSTNHFRAFFDDVAGSVHYVNTPGALNYDFADLRYQVFDRPYYPRRQTA